MQFRRRSTDRVPRPPLRVVPAQPAASAAQRDETLSRSVYFALVGGAIALGAFVRASIVLNSDFPLNDGGMFFAMVRDLQASHYALPPVTTYNASNIPFAYPPFALYVAALINDTTPISLLTIFRFLPLIVSSLTLFAFLGLARRVLDSRVAVVTAVFVFALLPATVQWMIMGGGLTRSFGFLFAILAIGQIHAMYTSRTLWRVPIATLLAALVVLSHIEMAWLTAFVSVLLFVAYGRNRRGVIASMSVAAGTLLLTSPWWGTVLREHGASPFIASLHSGVSWRDPIFLLIRFDATAEPLYALAAGLGLLGMFACVARRQFLLPAWVVAAALFDPRAFPTSAAMPVALLAAISVHDVLVPLIARRGPLSLAHHGAPGAAASAGSAAPAWLAAAAFTLGVCYITLSALVNSPILLTGMKRDERDAMHWAAANTPTDSRFAVVSGDGWSYDRTSEWFPVLAARTSIATVQGAEWLAGGAFAKQHADYVSLQACANQAPDCLDRWQLTSQKHFDYIYITKITPRLEKHSTDPCCTALRTALTRDPRYSVVYDASGATIFQRRP